MLRRLLAVLVLSCIHGSHDSGWSAPAGQYSPATHLPPVVMSGQAHDVTPVSLPRLAGRADHAPRIQYQPGSQRPDNNIIPCYSHHIKQDITLY